MLKRTLVLLGVLSVHTIFGQENVKAADEPKLDDNPYGVADAIKAAKELVEGQRQKRFYDYSYVGYNSGTSAFSSIIPTFPNYDTYHSTTAPTEQRRLSEILRRLEHIADLTRVFQSSAGTGRRPQIPIFIPIHTYPQGCTCPPTAPTPSTRPPATYLPPATEAPLPQNGTTMPDLGNRMGEDSSTRPNVSDDDYDDGVRPISFDPIPPKRPPSVTAPPVEHGSFQAGLDPEPPGSSPQAVGVPPQFDAPSAPPSVCDGAILSCCHRQEVTLDCFAKEGCGELQYDNPCEPKVLLNIVNKFRAHFKARG